MRPLLTSEGTFPRQASDPAEAMVRAVEFQQRHGLQLITDGEQRDDMLSLYGTLPGVQVTGGIPRIVDRIRPPEDPAQFPKIRDLDFLRARFPDVRFRVNLTAPTTFAFACASTGAGPAYKSAVDPRGHDDPPRAHALPAPPPPPSARPSTGAGPAYKRAVDRRLRDAPPEASARIASARSSWSLG